MAEIKVTIDADKVLAKFLPSGIPEQVRKNLRAVIPPLMRELSAEIDTNLSALKSRKNLQLKGGPQGEMIENADTISGRAEMTWTGDPKASMVPQILETGAKPHVISARNVKALHFFWPVMGRDVFFKSVNHPGFAGIHYMERAFDSMQKNIVDQITKAVNTGLNEEI